jgi:hypothetical protein
MRFIAVVAVLCLATLGGSRILLYNTEDTASLSVDCIYVLDKVDGEHGGSSAGQIPYCRRPNISDNAVRMTDTCENSGL